MALNQLSLVDYKQFQNLQLDLTYPYDHPDAGEPLQQICVIGPNSVGKTNLLQFIGDLASPEALFVPDDVHTDPKWALAVQSIRTETFKHPVIQSLLHKLGIRYNFSENFGVLESLYRNNVRLKSSEWGRGLEHLLLPLLTLLESESPQIVIIDTPETGIDGPTQCQLVDLYRQVAPNAQLIFATHSPYVLASFAPWEIVKLQFNEAGGTEQSQNWTESRKLDNFVRDPRYLRWDGIARHCLDVAPEGSPMREEGLLELSRIEHQLRRLRNEGADQDILRLTWQRYRRIASKLDWEID